MTINAFAIGVLLVGGLGAAVAQTEMPVGKIAVPTQPQPKLPDYRPSLTEAQQLAGLQKKVALLAQEVQQLQQRSAIDPRALRADGPPGLVCASYTITSPNDILGRTRTYVASILNSQKEYDLGTVMILWRNCRPSS